MAVEASEGRPLAPRQCSESEARMPPTLEKSLVPPRPGSCRSSRCPLGLPILWPVGVNYRLALVGTCYSGPCVGHSGLASEQLTLAMHSGVALWCWCSMTRIPRHDLRCRLPFFGVPLCFPMTWIIDPVVGSALPAHLYLGVIVRVRGCRRSTPMRCVGGEVRPSAHGSQCALAGAPSPSTRPCRRSPCAVRLAQ